MTRIHHPWTLVLLSGVLLFITLYFDHVGLLALVSLVPLLRALQLERNPWNAGFYSLSVGFAGICTVFYGVGFAYPLEVGPVLLSQSMCFFLPGFFTVWICSKYPRLESWLPLVFAFAWVAMETLVSQPALLGAYANGSIALGYTQARTPLLSLAAWVGVSGVSFVMLLINAMFAVLLRASRRSIRSWVLLGSSFTFVTVLISLSSWSITQAQSRNKTGLRIGVVQVAPSNKEDETASANVLSYAALTSSYAQMGAAMQGVDLLIWPEAAVRASTDDGLRMSVLTRALKHNPDSLLGIFRRDGKDVFNALMLWDRQTGTVKPMYDKRWLIGIFENHLTPGSASPVVSFKGIKLGLGICWESLFSSFAVDLVRNGAEVLVYPTSNVFAGNSVLPRLHAQANTFRAVETGRFVVTASKGGPSVIVAPNGRWLAHTELGEARVLQGLLIPQMHWTPYVKFGNVIGWGAVLMVSLATALLIASSIWTVLTRRRGAALVHP